MMQDCPSVSIIIVNWNRGDDVARSLRHLEGLRDRRTEVVVVDNGSTDGSAGWLAKLDSIRFVGLPTNGGPARRGTSA